MLNDEGAQEILNRLSDPTTNLLVYDCETNGLDWKTNFICGHVLTLGPRPQDTYYVPVRHQGGGADKGNLTPTATKGFEAGLAGILGSRHDLHLVGHHFMFDLMFLHGAGINPIGTLEDTEVNDALLDEFAGSHSLEAACLRTGTTPKKGDDLYRHLASMFEGKAERRAQMGNFWKLRGDDPVGFDYAAGDGTATWDLLHKQREALATEDMDGIRRLEAGVTRVIYRLTRRGVRVDEARLHEVIKHIEGILVEAKSDLPDDFNVRSSNDVKALLLKQGITGGWPMTEPTKRFPEGNPSFTEKYLEGIPVGQKILRVRKWSNLYNSFAGPLLERHLFHGRVHSTFTQMANDDFGTVTGRFSSSEPNLQQVPKRNRETAELIRSVFVPDEGLDWIDADLSQCEPRLLAHYSGSRVLLEGYLSKPSVDAHSAVATAANIDRESGKRLNQTLITGGGKKKIVAMLGSNGAAIYEAYFEAMPEVRRLQKQASSRMQARGFVISLLGRRARLEHYDKGYLAINRLLQCGNADVIKKAMVDIDAHFEANGDEVALLNTVHDALGMQGDMNNMRHKAQIMEALRLMTDFGPEGRSVYLRVPMAADYGIGKNWAEATYPKKKLTYGD